MPRKNFYLNLLAIFFTLLLIVVPNSFAQDTTNPPPLKQEQLDQLLAPIALYPDALLAQVLMASTYPLDIVQAERWARANNNLTADALSQALETQNWDPSVKSLINFPQVLEMLNTKLDWTENLGNAVINQQQDVMATVQKLRQKAQAQGNLKSTSEQKVTVEDNTQNIIIEPTNTEVVYVPIYDPTVIYGSWWYPAYPPYYYYPPGYVASGRILAFAAGVAVGSAWGYAWGGCNWHNGNIDIDANRNININHNINRNGFSNQHTWQHNPAYHGNISSQDRPHAQKLDQKSLTSGLKSHEFSQQKNVMKKQNINHDLNDRSHFDHDSNVRSRSISGVNRNNMESRFEGGNRAHSRGRLR